MALRGEQALTSAQLLARRIELLRGQLRTLEHGAAGGGAPAPVATAARERATGTQRALEQAWERLARAIADGVQRAHRQREPQARGRAVEEVVVEVRRLAEDVVTVAVEHAREQAEHGVRDGGTAGTPGRRAWPA